MPMRCSRISKNEQSMTMLESTTPLVIAAAAIHRNRNLKSHGMIKATKVGLSEMKNGLMTSKNHGKKGLTKILSGFSKKLND